MNLSKHEALRRLAMFDGDAPHNTGTNSYFMDAGFARMLERDAGCDLAIIRRIVGKPNPRRSMDYNTGEIR